MKEFVEQRIITAVREMLAGRVNEILGELEFAVPLVEFGDYSGGGVVVPFVSLVSSERSEKERVILIDAYSLSVTFAVPDTPESELYCYAYAAAVEKALVEDVTLGGAAERVVLAGKKYQRPQGSGREVVLSLRITNEQLSFQTAQKLFLSSIFPR